MKCLSILQPWASLILWGAKRFETRRWATAYRGPLVIHAGKRLDGDVVWLCQEEPYRSLLRRHGQRWAADLPRGVLLGVVELTDCVSGDLLGPGDLGEQELALGQFRAGCYAWKLERPRLLARPIRSSGRLGLYDLPELIGAEDLALKDN